MSILKPGQSVAVLIEKPAAGGRMIARVEGMVMLVAGAIPGERIVARVDRIGKGVAYADTQSVEEPSPDRVAVSMDPLCGGCGYAHIAYDRQREIKSLVIADAFARIAHLPLAAPVPVAASPVAGYRMRARLHRRGRRLGFFREGTHDLCDARQTAQLLPAASRIIDQLSEVLARAGDDVEAVEIAENVAASERVIHLQTGDSRQPLPRAVLSPMAEVTGLTVSASRGGFRVGSGSPYVTDRIDAVGGEALEVRRHVLAFFQGNRFLLRDLVAHVAAQVPAGSSVIDLYSGGGLFALAAAHWRRSRVTAVEGDRVGAADLSANAGANPGAPVRTLHQPVEAFLQAAPPATDVVIADPPRTGLSREALDGILRLRPTRLVYVSCDVATLARDARRFADSGYRLARLDAFDMFPNTPHVEAVAVVEME